MKVRFIELDLIGRQYRDLFERAGWTIVEEGEDLLVVPVGDGGHRGIDYLQDAGGPTLAYSLCGEALQIAKQCQATWTFSARRRAEPDFVDLVSRIEAALKADQDPLR